MFCTFLMSLLVTAPFTIAVTEAHTIEQHKHNQIKADQLKAWYNQKKAMTVLDARSEPYFDGTLLPKAKMASSRIN